MNNLLMQYVNYVAPWLGLSIAFFILLLLSVFVTWKITSKIKNNDITKNLDYETHRLVNDLETENKYLKAENKRLLAEHTRKGRIIRGIYNVISADETKEGL